MMFRKIKYFLLFIFLFLIGMAWYFSTTPYYTLLRSTYALKNKNSDELQYYCDLDSLSDSIIDEMLLINTKDLPNELAITLKMMQSDSSKIGFFKKMLSKGIKNQLINGIKKTDFQNNPDEKISIGSFLTMKNILMGEQVTVIKIDIQNGEEILPLHIRFRRLEGRWKLVGLEKFSEFLLKLIQSQRGNR